MRVMAYCDGENVERPLVAELLSDLPDGGGRIQTPVAVMFRNRFVDGVPAGDIGVMGDEVRFQFPMRLRVLARFAVQRNLVRQRQALPMFARPVQRDILKQAGQFAESKPVKIPCFQFLVLLIIFPKFVLDKTIIRYYNFGVKERKGE